MRTTLSLDDDVLIAVQERARRERRTTGAVLSDLARQALTGQHRPAGAAFRPLVDGIDVEVKGANDPSDPFPTPTKLLTIDKDFGGWSAANTKFFDEDKGLVTKIQAETGKQ